MRIIAGGSCKSSVVWLYESYLSLGIHSRVPVTVIKNDRIGTRQVDTDASRPGRQDEAEVLRVRVEALHQNLALLDLRWTVESEVSMPLVVHEGLQDVQDFGHLGEEEDTVTSLFQLLEETS